jgi:hypothetical protein
MKLSKMQQRVNLAVRPPVFTSKTTSVTRINPVESAQSQQSHDEDGVPNPAFKGRKDANCNRTACQKPRAFFLNCGTDKYYCVECAIDIGCFSLSTRQDPMELFPTFDEDMVRYEKYLEDNELPATRYLKSQVDWAKRERADALVRYQRNTAQPA